jgi:inner membrane protein
VEPVTHVLTGVCLARTGPNRTTAYATLTMAVAAQLPDIDTLWSLRGPVEGFQHHRGITHTFLGVPFEAAALVAAVYAWHRWRSRRPSPRPLIVPPRWGLLYLWALVALLSHLLLDFTNNYGLRPFFPFNPHWYAASIVFIFDPFIFLLLVGALVAPYLFALVGSEVGARRQPFRGQGLAIAALLGIVAWWGLRFVEHTYAIQQATKQSIAAPTESAPAVLPSSDDASAPDAPTPVYLTPQRVLASPDILSPFRWSTVADFGPVYQLAEVNTRLATYRPSDVLTPKPAWTPAERAAAASPIGRAYLDWSSMPFIEQMPTPAGGSLIVFRDPRFLGGRLAELSAPPLTATVTLDPAHRVLAQTMDGRTEPRR